MDAPIEFEPPDPSQETVMQAQDYAIASRSAREAWLVASTYYRLYLWEIIDGKASGVRPIVRSKYEPKETPNDRLIQLQHISAYNVGEQRWVLLGESSAAAVRLLRVDDPSCVYPDGKEGVAP